MLEKQFLIEKLDAAGFGHYQCDDNRTMVIYTSGGTAMVDHESKLWDLADWCSVEPGAEFHPYDILIPILEECGYKFDESKALGCSYWD